MVKHFLLVQRLNLQMCIRDREKGEKLHECFLQKIDNVEEKVREGIDEEELQTFFKVAKQIRENLEQMQ